MSGRVTVAQRNYAIQRIKDIITAKIRIAKAQLDTMPIWTLEEAIALVHADAVIPKRFRTNRAFIKKLTTRQFPAGHWNGQSHVTVQQVDTLDILETLFDMSKPKAEVKKQAKAIDIKAKTIQRKYAQHQQRAIDKVWLADADGIAEILLYLESV